MAALPSAESTVRAYSLSCISLFNRYRQDLPQSSKPLSICTEDAWAEDQEARFNIWADTLGVFARGHADADHRLENRIEDYNLMRQLLHALEANLLFAVQGREALARRFLHTGYESNLPRETSCNPSGSSTPERSMDESSQVGHSNGMNLDASRGRDDGLQLTYAAPFTFSSASSSSGASEDSIGPDLLEAHRQVQDAISRLNRMSTWIRRLGARYRDAKAEDFQDIDENNDNLTLMFKGWAAFKVKLSIPRATEELQHRMVMTIARRRNQIAYRKKHQQKLAQRVYEIKPEVSKESKLHIVSKDQSPLLPPLRVADQDRISRQSRIPMSTTSASGAGSARPYPNLSEKASSVASGAISTVASTFQFDGKRACIPPPPTEGDDNVFPCPYCCIPCPNKERRHNLWRKHFRRDIKPYICVFPDCETPEDSFATVPDWISHMENHLLLEWRCLVCETSEHFQTRFDTEESYISHLQDQHAKKFNDAEFRLLTNADVRRSTQTFTDCPFCGGIPADITASHPDTKTMGLQDSLCEHITRHLDELALISLEWFNDLGRGVSRMQTPEEIAYQWSLFDDSDMSPVYLDAEWETLPVHLIPDDESWVQWIQSGQNSSTRYQEWEDWSPFVEIISQKFGNLATQIVTILQNSEEDGLGKPYFPSEMLASIVADDAAMKTALNSPLESTIAFSKENPRVFAITLLATQDTSSRDLAMRIFSHYKFTDASLPVENLHHSEICPYIYDGTKDNCNHKAEGDAFHYSPWRLELFNIFFDKQWSFCVPKFDEAQFVYHFNDQTILPIARKFKRNGVVEESGIIGKGSLIEVQFVTMLAKYQTAVKTGEEKFITVALKEFKLQKGDPYNNFENWERESKALKMFNKLNNPHIVRGIGAYTQDNQYFIIMERAEHGDLTSIWNANVDVHLSLNESVVAEFLEQFRGLANALRVMHQYKAVPGQSSEIKPLSGSRSPPPMHNTPGGLGEPAINAPTSAGNWRHGDLRPANILSFNGKGSLLGTLKLADLGRARQYASATKDRFSTVGKYSTWDYDPPEIWADLEKERSRFVDIWSFGCVLLESLIWLLFGSKELANFLQQPRDGFGTLYWSVGNMSKRTTMLKNSTFEWLSRLLKDDPECQSREQGSAMHDLLKLIINGLLVVKYPEDYEKVQMGMRFNCQKLVEELDGIIEKGRETPGYLFSGQEREGIVMPQIAQVGNYDEQDKHQYLSPYRKMSGANFAQRRTSAPWQARPPGSPDSVDHYMHEFNKWRYVDDAAFATRVMRLLQGDLCQLLPKDGLSVACDVCQSIDLNKPNFGIDCSPTKHHQSQASVECELCGYLLGIAAEASERYTENPESQARKQSIGAAQDLTVLTIRRIPEPGQQRSKASSHLRMCLPVIPKGGSIAHFKIMKAWLDECDRNHRECRSLRPSSSPTRVIDVGTTERPCLRLVESSLFPEDKRNTIRYIALSHPWGRYPPHEHFVTNPTNFAAHRSSITGTLPQTLADAVTTARHLNVPYLWIDSLCIIQGPDGDFAQEADRMEEVFSSAYCVIAASSAEGSTSGFLNRKSKRELGAEMNNGEGGSFPQSDGDSADGKQKRTVLVEESFDNFDQDVLQGPLNQDGWVFQERALARRTIFFTNNQTYFECGDGIRCETLTKMKNTRVRFLGDPNFPKYGLQGTKEADIVFFQDLYEEYSKKSFTNIEDRPFAISGLEQRLGEALSAKNNSSRGYWGIVDDHWARSLLWRRADGVPKMIRLTKGPAGGLAAPSWSWEGYSGAINYLKPEPRTVEWHSQEVTLPWANMRGSSGRMTTASYQGNRFLKGKAKDFRLPTEEAGDGMTHDIVFDDPATRSLRGPFKVLVIGHLKLEGVRREKVRNFVLVLAKKTSGRDTVYERVGAGFLDGSMILHDKDPQDVLVE